MSSVRAAAGLAALLTAVVAFWWLAGVYLSLSLAAIPGAMGATALGALWLTRGMGLSVLAAQSGAAPLRASVPMLAALAQEYGFVWELTRPGGGLPPRARWRERDLRAVARRLGERQARLGFERAVRGFEAVVTGRADDPRVVVEMATAAGADAGTR